MDLRCTACSEINGENPHIRTLWFRIGELGYFESPPLYPSYISKLSSRGQPDIPGMDTPNARAGSNRMNLRSGVVKK